jgi:chromosomal replication initiator protein
MAVMTSAETTSTPIDGIWSKVCDIVRAEMGDTAFSSYLAGAAVRRAEGERVVLVTPTGYARDWVRRNAHRRIAELWRAHDRAQRRLELASKLEFELENPEAGNAPAGDAAPAPAVEIVPTARASSVAPPPRGGLGVSLQERWTFDSYVEGAANRFAVETARQVASWKASFNPVLLHGPFGQGKTHLLHAIAWEAQRRAPEKTVVYITADRFLNGFVRAVMDRTTAAFKDQLRSADLLLVDDVHIVGNKPSTQEELFSTITWLVEEGGKVVLSADRPPAELTELDARLRSHLCAGLVCGVQAPDRSLRMAIAERRLEVLARAAGVRGAVKLEVLQFLADRFSDNVRELEGAVNTVFAHSADRLGALSVDETALIIRPHLKGTERRVTVDEIQKTVAAHFALKQEDLLSARRQRAVARPRQAAMYLAKTMTTRSYPDIGRRFGGRDHTTVLHAVKVIEKLIASDPQMARDIEALQRTLRG